MVFKKYLIIKCGEHLEKYPHAGPWSVVRWRTLKYLLDGSENNWGTRWTVDCGPALVQKMSEIFQLRNNSRAKEPRRGRWWSAG